MDDPQAVEVQFRLRPLERMLYALLFWRGYRIVAFPGLLLLGVGVVPALGEVRQVFLGFGVLLVLGFVWLPFAVSPRAAERRFQATDGVLTTYVQGLGGGPIEWRSFHRTRRRAGALTLEMKRAFERGQLEAFELLAARGIESSTGGTSVPANAGEPILSYRYPVGVRDFILGRAMEFEALAALIVGVALAAFGLVLAQSDPVTNGSVASGWIAAGVIVAAMPWAIPIAALLVAGPRRIRESAAIGVYRSGYYVSGPSIATWSAWSSFGSAREKRNELTLQLGTSRRHCHLSIAPLTVQERAKLREILADAGLTPSS
jgi:hypothetical protein